MADNYLEKRMEDYRKGGLQKTKSTAAGRRSQGVAGLRLAYQTALVAIADPALREAVVNQFAASGCRTAFLCADSRKGAALAQASGAMFCPAVDLSPDSVERMAAVARERWGELGLLVADSFGLRIEGSDTLYIIGSSPAWRDDPRCDGQMVLSTADGDSPAAVALAAAVMACRDAGEMLKILRR